MANRRPALFVLVLLGAVTVSACAAPGPSGVPSTSEDVAAEVVDQARTDGQVMTALAALSALAVSDEPARPGYDRALFAYRASRTRRCW